MTHEDLDEVAALPVDLGTGSEPTTVRNYLLDLLATLWREGSDFSAKRPLGSSDWQWPVYEALAEAGYLGATPRRGESLSSDQVREADRLVELLILDLDWCR